MLPGTDSSPHFSPGHGCGREYDCICCVERGPGASSAACFASSLWNCRLLRKLATAACSASSLWNCRLLRKLALELPLAPQARFGTAALRKLALELPLAPQARSVLLKYACAPGLAFALQMQPSSRPRSQPGEKCGLAPRASRPRASPAAELPDRGEEAVAARFRRIPVEQARFRTGPALRERGRTAAGNISPAADRDVQHGIHAGERRRALHLPRGDTDRDGSRRLLDSASSTH